MADLPEIIPIFPLPNFVLFPHVKVPLHIFEPRYRQMVAEVADGHGIIGMTMLKGDWESDYHAFPDIYEIGCAGKIEKLMQLPDGRFNLILGGLSEFRVVREIRERAYRRAQVIWCTTPAGKLDLDDAGMRRLLDLLVSLFGEAALKAWRALVEEQGMHGAELVNFLCSQIDVSPMEKQTLLEARESRVGCLLDVLTFKLEERKLGPGGSAGGGSSPVQ